MPKKDYKMLAFLTAWILVSRAILYKYIPYFDPFLLLHHLDPSWLREDLLTSVYYLHAQPPLFNLILGGLLKLTPLGGERLVLTTFFLLLALGIGAMTYRLLRIFSISPRLAFIATAFVLTIPQERWLNYNIYFVVFLLLAATLSLYQTLRSAKLLPLLIFGLTTAGIVWTRSFFHLIFWFMPIVFFTIWLVKNDKNLVKKVVPFTLTMVFFLFIGSVPYLKNYVEFGFLGGSSWLGMNMANMTRYVGEENFRDSLASGEVTPLIQVERFAPVEVYQSYYGAESETGIEVLDATEKANETVNANHSIYLQASAEYKKNAITLIKKYPGAYTKAVANELYIFMGFIPYKFFDTYPDWHINQITPSAKLNEVIGVLDTFVVPPLFFVAFLMALVQLIRYALENHKKGNLAQAGVSAFMVFNILYVLAIANLIELGEGNFFRVPIDVFLLVGFMLFLRKTYASKF